MADSPWLSSSDHSSSDSSHNGSDEIGEDNMATDFKNPYHLEGQLPSGLVPGLELCFDDFFFSKPNLIVNYIKLDAYGTYTKGQDTIQDLLIKTLKADNLRKRKYFCYFSAAAIGEFDKQFKIPNMVQKVDLLANVWPKSMPSRYLKRKSKLFYCYTKGYKSQIHKTYAGLTEWIYVMTGELTIDLFRPTQLNTGKYYQIASRTGDEEEDGEELAFVPESDTRLEIKLKKGDYLVIPSNYLSIRTAHEHTYALAGQFLHYKSVTTQINAFNWDIHNVKRAKSPDINAEIRHILWYLAAKLNRDHCKSSDKEVISCNEKFIFIPRNFRFLDFDTLTLLKDTLTGWLRPFEAHLYAPTILTNQRILKDLSSLIQSNRMALKRVNHVINLPDIETPTDDETD